MITLMTYNIGQHSKNGLNAIIEVIRNESPDILVLNELNILCQEQDSFNAQLSKLNLPNFALAESPKSINNTAIYSRFGLENISPIEGLQNAGIVATAKTENGEISIAGIHLASNTEDTRLMEIAKVIFRQKNFPQRLIIGDLNSVSSYNRDIKSQSSSCVTEPEYRYDVTTFIEKSGYIDTAVYSKKSNICTVPITKEGDITYFDLRLDYIFMSTPLADRISDYNVINNKSTNLLSDHYPIVVQLR